MGGSLPSGRVRKLKLIKGPYAVAGQYQQSPTIRGGGIISREWWQLWAPEKFPEFGTIIVSLDTALEEKKDSDYNACVVCGAFEGLDGAPKLMLMDGLAGADAARSACGPSRGDLLWAPSCGKPRGRLIIS